jgi:hypothetical protein
MRALLAGLLLVLGCYGGEASDACVVRPFDAPPSCATRPDLCDLRVHADLRQRDPAFAVDVVFLPEGFADDELEDFHARVRTLLHALEQDRGGIVGRDPQRFNRYTVDLPAAQGLSVTDGALDTPLSGCLRRDTVTPEGRPLLTVHPELVRFAARRAVPAADVAVVLMNLHVGRANAPLQRASDEDLGVVVIGLDDVAHVLDHELGHALVNLGDEYVDGGDCYLRDASPPGVTFSPGDWWTTLAEQPNLTTDPNGARWSSVLRGARAGGARFARCVYHPTDRCRMGDDSRDGYCPVCDDAIERALRDVRAGVDNRPPRCGLYVPTTSAAGSTLVCPFARGAGGPVRMALRGPDGEALLDAVWEPRPANTTPSLMLGRGCARVPLPTGAPRTLRLTCWTVTGASAESALTLTP